MTLKVNFNAVLLELCYNQFIENLYMKYDFECTVSEITTSGDGKLIAIKVVGTESYVLQKKEDDKTIKFNVFVEENNGHNAYRFEVSKELKICTDLDNILPLLTTALTSGKRIKMKVEKVEEKESFLIEKLQFRLESLSILAN